MGETEKIDVKENKIIKLDETILALLLKDNTTGKNIIWGTDNYSSHGFEYEFSKQILIHQITGRNGEVIKPRVEKTKKEQQERIKQKAEVFTPSWTCNIQNNLVDNAWFGYSDVFNVETNNSWNTNKNKIIFPEDKDWRDYVCLTRMEVACGEAPYLTSRYDTVSGKEIRVKDRIGLIDRKLRIINENVKNIAEWMEWVKKAYQNIYGFEWQGDNLLLARENLLYTFIDNYEFKFGDKPSVEFQKELAEIISWNIWQMDGIKFVVPNSCHNEIIIAQPTLFDNDPELSTIYSNKDETIACQGCQKNQIKKHNGIYCKIKDWDKNKTVTFVNLVVRGVKG